MNIGIKIVLMSFFCAFLLSSNIIGMQESNTATTQADEVTETTIFFIDDLDALLGYFLTTKNKKEIERIDFSIPYKFGLSIEKLFPELHDQKGNKKEYLGKNINVQDWLNLLCEKLITASRRSQRAPLDTTTVLESIALQKLAKKRADVAKKKSAAISSQQKLSKSSLSGIKKTRKKNR